MTHWLLRVGDGENFVNSSVYKIWGISSTSPFGKNFLRNVKHGDILWFIKSKSQGRIMAAATYQSHNRRDIGPLISTTMDNDELGWTGEGLNWRSDTEIHYTELYALYDVELLTHIKCPTTIRKYNEKCQVNLPVEYENIVRYRRCN